MDGFNGDHCKHKMRPYYEKYFEVLEDLFRSRDNEFNKTFFRSLNPKSDDL